MPNDIAIGVAYEDQRIVGGTIDRTPIGATTPAAGSFTTLVSSGNSRIADAATDTLSFYGATPVSQRASSVQAASVVSASTYITVPANLAAWAAEVSDTLTGLGLWKGAA